MARATNTPDRDRPLGPPSGLLRYAQQRLRAGPAGVCLATETKHNYNSKTAPKRP